MCRTLKTFDVAVVGAGPAGASAAGHLAAAGVQVIILEQQPWPRDKTCGGGLVARALKELPDGMAAPAQHHCHQASIYLNDIKLGFNSIRQTPIVTMIMRTAFDQALVAAAIEKGAIFQETCRVINIRQDAAAVKLDTAAGPVHARMVIAADGARSHIAHLAGWQDGRILAPALEWEIAVNKESLQSHSDVARFDFGVIDDGYAWIFPKADHLSVGLVTMRNRARHLPATLASHLTGMGIPFGRSVSRKGFLIPVSPRRGKHGNQRTLLVGDAAGFTDPITAEGISYALQSGRLAAEAVVDGGLDPSRTTSGYQRRLKQALLPEIACGQWLAALLYRMPACRRWIFTRQGQRLAEGMTDVMMGDLSYREAVRNSSFWLRVLGLRASGTHKPHQ